MSHGQVSHELWGWVAGLPEAERLLAERCLAGGARSRDALLAMLLEMQSSQWNASAWEFFDPTRVVGGRRHEKQLEAVRLSLTKRIVLLMWGNRVGKSQLGAYSTSRHMTGVYPAWWDGLRFGYPITGYAVSTSRAKQLEVVQPLLIGKPGRWGEGCYIPKDRIVGRPRMSRTAPDTVESVDVAFGANGDAGVSTLFFRTYEQGRTAFESALLDWIWADEEPPDDVFEEMKMRLVGNLWRKGGNMLVTFTPNRPVLSRLCKLALYKGSALEEGLRSDDVGTVSASWEDNPYLPPDELQHLLDTTDEKEQRRRRHGLPTLGAGAIFDLGQEDYAVDWFQPPVSWPFGAGLDFGWRHPTAVCWGVRDPQSGVTYIYNTWRRSQAELPVLKQVLETEGLRYPIFADRSGRNKRQEAAGKSLFDLLAELGVFVYPADNDIEPAVLELQTGLRNGTLKIMKTCTPLLEEMSLYHRKDNGKITEELDDLVDALRYFYRNRMMLGYREGQRPARHPGRLRGVTKPGSWRSGG